MIHTDFEKTFIQCIAYNYDTLKEHGDENAVKAAGKVMTKGKDYGEFPISESCIVPASDADNLRTVVEDGDIILIKAGAAKA